MDIKEITENEDGSFSMSVDIDVQEEEVIKKVLGKEELTDEDIENYIVDLIKNEIDNSRG